MGVVTWDPKKEFAVLLGVSASGLLAFFLAHTFYVTASTYWYGLVLAAALVASFWVRLRKRVLPMPRWLRVAANVILVILILTVLTYLMGVATWYE